MSTLRISDIDYSEETAGLGKCKILKVNEFVDPRGKLNVIDFSSHLPFVPRRMFWTHGVEEQGERGNHAHKRCDQILVCMAGEIHVTLDDGKSILNLLLDTPSRGVLVPRGTWSKQTFTNAGSILMVFASDEYDEKDYLNDYNNFLQWVKQND